MTHQRELDRILDAFLADGHDEVADRVIDAALDQIDHTRQRRALRMPRRFQAMPMLTRLAAAAVIGVIAVGGAFFLGQRGQPAAVGGPSQTPGASASHSETVSPSAGPSPSVVAPRAASWTATGSMITAGWGYTATLLPDGKVLVAGGNGGNGTSAELYDPGTGSWTATGRMVTPRSQQLATLLPDGKVLVAGGFGLSSMLTSAELYDPTTGSWTAIGSMALGHIGVVDTATLLRDGRVLVAGGQTSGIPGSSEAMASAAELYDPGSRAWTTTGSMIAIRADHTATLLPDGKVLVAGGGSGRCLRGACGLAVGPTSAELYDPGSGTWTVTMPMVAQDGGTATLLRDGRVLVAGRLEAGGVSAELFDPGTASWSASGDSKVTMSVATATPLSDGRVLLTGFAPGCYSCKAVSVVVLYDPGSGG
jgi:hypothetical protein